jgi:hypothetical protein
MSVADCPTEIPGHTEQWLPQILIFLLFTPKATSKPDAPPIRELEKCAQDVHWGVGFGIENYFNSPLPRLPQGGFGDFRTTLNFDWVD